MYRRFSVPLWLILSSSLFLLAACSNLTKKNPSLSNSAAEVKHDIVSVEQYKPDLPVLEASSLSLDRISSLEANGAAKLIKEYRFSNGKEFTYITVGDMVVEGDALISTEEKFIDYLEKNENLLSGEGQALSSQGAFAPFASRWPGGIVYWERISLNAFNSTQRTAILNSMQEITNKTDVGFLGDTGQASRITFTNENSGCWSAIGRTGQIQRVNLADNCFGNSDYLTTIIHEINHALGMIHEHNRPERDNFIQVNTNNLTPYGLSQFQVSGATVWSSYDYLSIMHYPRYTSDTKFVKNTSLPMFTTPGYNGTVRSSRLSAKDISTINSAY